MIDAVADALRTLPGPTGPWADIIGHIAWPILIAFLLIRFRRYIRLYLETLADRLKTDHVRIGAFELTPDAPIWVLDPAFAEDSTYEFGAVDIQRIERLLEYIADHGVQTLIDWLRGLEEPAPPLDAFVTLPAYAALRARAFAEIEGLSL